MAALVGCSAAPQQDGAKPQPPALSAPMPPPAAPPPAPPPDGAENQAGKAAVMKVLVDTMAPWWTPEQRGLLFYIGYYSAASAMCDTLEIDQAKVDTLMRTKFLQPQGKSKGPAAVNELRFRKEIFLMHLGMVTGAVMGSHRGDLPGFCNDAADMKVRIPGASNLFKLSR
ncbi:hypothetical protein QTI33_16380 [Variovorax sp. J22P271]|uniref:hypothetical protein n=1 Tax=Variovorax davisae TaxID=3053515 RepID=UPI0025785DD8|nr:hypothetical protein [Variovorax sp. J22P271]MDM0033712.1 hypothetical protein [Variovorax sp. J22P271]